MNTRLRNRTRVILAVIIGLAYLTPGYAQNAEPWTQEWPDVVDSPEAPWGDQNPQYQWESENGYYWIFSRDVQRDGKLISAWIREEFKSPLADGTSKLLTRITFDCEGQFRYSAQSSYRADGTLVQEIDRLDKWTFIRPDTKLDVYQTALCKSASAL